MRCCHSKIDASTRRRIVIVTVHAGDVVSRDHVLIVGCSTTLGFVFVVHSSLFDGYCIVHVFVVIIAQLGRSVVPGCRTIGCGGRGWALFVVVGNLRRRRSFPFLQDRQTESEGWMGHHQMHRGTYRSICFITGGEEKRLMEKFRNGVFHLMHLTLEKVTKVNISLCQHSNREQCCSRAKVVSL